MKWGEYSSDVQFMLQRSDPLHSASEKSPVNELKAALTAKNALRSSAATASASAAAVLHKKPDRKSTSIDETPAATAPLASPTHRHHHRSDINVGIVRGIPQQSADSSPQQQQQQHNNNALNNNNPAQPPQHSPPIPSTIAAAKLPTKSQLQSQSPPQNQQQQQQPNQNYHHTEPSISSTASSSAATTVSLEFNTADVRNSLDRKTTATTTTASNISSANSSANSSTAPADEMATAPANATAAASLLSLLQPNASPTALLYAQGPPISSNGALVPPPYRDPPPPRASPSDALLLQQRFDAAALVHAKDTTIAAAAAVASTIATAVAEPATAAAAAAPGVLFHTAHYRELVQLIKYQRDQLNVQHADLGKFDAEIGFLEQREREQLQQLDAIAREIGAVDHQFRCGQEQLQQLQYVEEENELVHQQEKTLKSEITLLRSKLANCETELLQYKNKVRLLLDDIQVEQRQQQVLVMAASAVAGPQLQLERHFMSEVERIQAEIDQAVRMAENAHQTADHLKQEVAGIELTIAEKKKQVEQLVNEMKEVNLQSLTTVAPSDEIRHLLEGKWTIVFAWF